MAQTLPITDFSGGWNPRDAWSQVGDNESPDMYNVTLDQRGGVMKRLGLTRLNGADQIVNTGNVQSLFYSVALDKMIAQVGADLYVSTDGGINWGASIKTFTTSERCHMVDFLSKVVIIHPTDKAFSYDGATVSAVIANSPKGSCIAVWQNALWSIGDPAMTSRVTRSDLGAITWPATPVSNDIRAVNDKPLTAIGGGIGIDTQGRSGLMVYKEDSQYRIHDSATGAYAVMDLQFGASGPACVTTNSGITVALCKRGVSATVGDGTAPLYVSGKIEPLFREDQITFSTASTWQVANYRDRVVMSLARDGATTNNFTLEFHPNEGWFCPHGFGVSSFTNYTKNTNLLIGGKVGTAAASYGYVLNVFSGGSDDGVAIDSRWQGRWFEPTRGSEARFRRLLVAGRGSFNLLVKRNYTQGLGDVFPIAITADSTDVWGGKNWGAGYWNSELAQEYDRIFSLGHGRSISFEIQESSSTSATGITLLDDGAAPTIGAWALYGLYLDVISLGQS